MPFKVQAPEFAPRVHAPDTKVEAHGWRLRNDFYTLHVDSVTGGIRSLIAGGREWVDDSTGWTVGQIIHETINAAGERDDIELPPTDADYDYRPHLAPQYAGTSAVTEKQFIAGKGHGRFFLRVDAPSANDAYVQIVLYDELPYIDLIIDIDKQIVTAPESLYVAFPLAVENPVPRYEVAGAIVEAETQQLINATRDYYSIQNWVDCSNDHYGVTLASPDVNMLHIGGFYNNAHLQSLEIGQPLLVSWPMNNHWWTNFKRDQSGWTRFRYRLWLHDGPFDAVKATHFGADMATPPLVGPLTDVFPGFLNREVSTPVHLPAEQASLYSLSPENVQIASTRITESEVIIDLQEIAGESADYTLRIEGMGEISGSIEPFRISTIRKARS